MDRPGAGQQDVADEEYFDHVLYWAAPQGERQLGKDTVAWLAWWHSRTAGCCVVRLAPQLRAEGSTRAATRHALATGRWTPAGKGAVACFAICSDDRHLQERRAHAVRAAGAALRSPGTVIGERSGAVLHGLPLRNHPVDVGLVRRSAQRSGTRSGVRTATATVADDEVVDWFGVPVTTVARTLVDVARLDAEDGIVAADHALRENLVTRAELATALERAAGLPGIRRAREVLGLADRRADSPLESLVRLVLHDAGFPPPELQFRIGPYFADFAWPQLRLVLEADGLGKYDPTDAAQRRRRRDERGREKKREQYFRRVAFQTERVTWDEVTVGRDEFVGYLRGVVTLRRAELAGGS